jgi:hypothetical protein
MEFCNFFFQINYRLRHCLPQQMSEVTRRIFIYLQLTYDWLPIFLQPVLAVMLLIHGFSPKCYPGKHMRTVVANIMFFTVLCILLLFLQ